MAESTEARRVLRSCVEKIDCSFVEGQNGAELVIRKAGLNITITVPNSVQEWYVDVEEPSTGLKARDWYDYAGYESPGSEDLDRDMAEDLKLFMENVLTSPLRMRSADQRKARGVLEWQVDNAWKQAVPADGR